MQNSSIQLHFFYRKKMKATTHNKTGMVNKNELVEKRN